VPLRALGLDAGLPVTFIDVHVLDRMAPVRNLQDVARVMAFLVEVAYTLDMPEASGQGSFAVRTPHLVGFMVYDGLIFQGITRSAIPLVLCQASRALFQVRAELHLAYSADLAEVVPEFAHPV